ncbi:MAG: hypothetical protein Q9166_000410 [cf. Caloplaca sp. 2 TL-2023]
MEPLSIVLLTANLLALVDNFYRGARFVRKVAQDPRIDGLYVRLLTEKARYAEWKRRMGVKKDEEFKTLISKLPEDARHSLPMILTPMKKYLKLTEDLFEKYGVLSPDTMQEHRTLRDKIRRFDLLLDGQRQIDDLIETLKNCNDGLLTIAPPAPGYYVSLSSDDQILETGDQTPDSLRRLQAFQSGIQAGSLASSNGSEGPTTQNPDALIHPAPDQELSEKTYHPVIELLYATCLKVVRLIALRYPTHRPAFQNVGDRLQIWGTGLFRGQISIDQAFDQKSKAVTLLRSNIAGTLADMAVVLREYENSTTALQLREIFAIPEISMLPLGDTWAGNNDEQEEEAGGVNVCCEEIADLTECLFGTLSTAEMVMTQTIARQVRNPATEERELVLLESESDLSLQNVEPGPAKDLLQIDLQLIAALQSSLEDSKFAKYMDHRKRKFDAVQLYKELGNEARQMKYWADKLANNSDGCSMTSETQAAMMLNLTNIARTFAAGFRSEKTSKHLDHDLQTVLQQCARDFPELEGVLEPSLGEDDKIDPLDVLKSSNVELRKLAGSKAPSTRYTEDFALSEKAKLAAEYSAASASVSDAMS